jgi:hypothetical protein
MNLNRYIEGIRKGREINSLERKAMQDPFLADALAGYDQVKGNHSDRIEEMIKQVTLQTQPQNKTFRYRMIAAAVLVLAVAGFYLFSGKPFPFKNPAPEEEKIQMPLPVSSPETDSLPLPFAFSGTTGRATFAIPDSLLRSALPGMFPDAGIVRDSIAGEEETQNREEEANKKDKPLLSKPAVGYGAYYKYLKTQLIRPADEICGNAKGKVVLSFSVNGNGRPEEIAVTHSLCPSADAEAIRLVKEGPGWTAGETRVTVIVRF